MRVFVSSTFVDLQDYRAAGIRILRQLGHEVVAIEDYVADSAIPLGKVLDDVQSCDAYVGIFAWRYGYIPGAPSDADQTPAEKPTALILPKGADYGSTSITHWEYLQAKQDPNRQILAFLLEEGVAWPPHLIDGFGARTSKDKILNLRQELQRQRIVAYFKSPADLEAWVSAAITTVKMSKQVELNLLDPAASTPGGLQSVSQGEGIKDNAKPNFVEAVVKSQSERVVRIDIATKWWSTRLYLLAYLVHRLTDVCRILILDRNDFAGLLPTTTIKSQLRGIHPELAKFEWQMARRQISGIDLWQEVEAILDTWNNILPLDNERRTQKQVTRANLKWWFGDTMLGQALNISDLGSATAFDLARLLDFPSHYVPVITSHRNLSELKGHSKGIDIMEFLNNEEKLVSVDEEGKILVWNFDDEYLLGEAKRIAGRNLSRNKWGQFLPSYLHYKRTYSDLPEFER